MGESGALWALVALAATAAALAAAQPDAEDSWFCPGKELCLEDGDACVASHFGCPTGYVRLEGAAACGCCGGCVQPLEEGQYCNDAKPCAYGFFCDTKNIIPPATTPTTETTTTETTTTETTTTETTTTETTTTPTMETAETVESTESSEIIETYENRENDETSEETYHICSPGICTEELKKWTEATEKNEWQPSCDRNGAYASVQCKGQIGGNGRCFCWSPEGQRLYGEAVWGKASEDMDCACSLAALRAKKEHEAPRCTTDGSFEALQCAAGVCWCADRLTGKPQGRAVPINAMSSLLCYNLDDVGVQYRRVCDSVMEGNAELDRVYKSHGGSSSGLPNVACDLNGGHGAVQIRVSGTETFCSRQDKTQIESFFQETDPSRPMNCNCARDSDAFEEKLPCYSNGNYKARINDGDNARCIDSDGYYSETIKSNLTCLGEIK